MRIAQEEIFGPVLVVIPYQDEDEAVRLANDSAYGLGGGEWTSYSERGMRIARRIRTGFFIIHAEPVGFPSPFGGHKADGVSPEDGSACLASVIYHHQI